MESAYPKTKEFELKCGIRSVRCLGWVSIKHGLSLSEKWTNLNSKVILVGLGFSVSQATIIFAMQVFPIKQCILKIIEVEFMLRQ